MRTERDSDLCWVAAIVATTVYCIHPNPWWLVAACVFVAVGFIIRFGEDT